MNYRTTYPTPQVYIKNTDKENNECKDNET